MNYLFSNNATSWLAIGTGSSSAVLTLTAGHGGRFPQPLGDGSNGFPVTIEDRRTNQLEICFCTLRNGDMLQVLRGQEGTPAQDFIAGATVSHRMTAGTLAGLQQQIETGGITIDAADGRYVMKTGDIMSGNLSTAPAFAPSHVTTKDYVDTLVADLDTSLSAEIAAKEPAILGGLPTDYWGGDKQWHVLPEGLTGDFVDAAGDTMTGNLIIAANNASLHLQANPSTVPTIVLQEQTADRWTQGFGGAGADYFMARTPNVGSAAQVYTISRATGVFDFKVVPTVNGTPISVGMSLGLTAVSDAAPVTPIDNTLWWQSSTGYLYLRYNDGNGPSQWVQVNPAAGSVPEAPLDGQNYVRHSGGWAVAGSTSGFVTEAPTDGQSYLRRGSPTGWVVGTTEAPTDGQAYVRKSAAWVVETIGITQAAADARYVNITGGEVMTGPLTLPGLVSSSYVNGVTASFSGIQPPGGYLITGNCTSGGGGGVLGYSGPSYGIVGYNNNYSLYGNNTIFTGADVQANIATIVSTIQSINGKGIFGGTTTTASSANCNITTGGGLYRSTASTLAVKKDVEPLWDSVGDAILKLKPIWHRYRINILEPDYWGFYSFGAEEVAEVDRHFAAYDHAQAFDEKGDMIFDWKEEEHLDPDDPTKTVMKLVPIGPKLSPEKTPQHINWHAVTTALVNLVQRQEKRIQALEASLGL